MDTNEEERAKGKTVEVGRAHFASETKRFTILDAPGHKGYVPNMIQGASQADVGILVISARRGEFETGFERGGQTREHAILAKTLGVQHLIVVINKMDDPTVQWDKERFDECCSKLKPFLKQCGFRPKFDVRFIPISGLTGANVMNEVDASECSWWRECYTATPPANFTTSPTLLQQLDALEVPRDKNGPLRIPVLDRFTDRGTIIMGKVESGTIRRGQKVRIMPINREVTASAVYCDEDPVNRCLPGENVRIKLNDVTPEEISKGFVICDLERPCSQVTTFRGQVALVDMLEHRPLFTPGYTCMFHAHCAEETVRCTRIASVKVRGEDKKQRFARQGNVVSCELQLERSVCLETYEDMEQLGRFTLRDEGQTIGIGKLMRIMN
uniref:Tr-type G domain-containing protein n=1 Tax=Phaeomonas parva TaxID=124430 RepID=A0A7S1U2E8_9STRA